MSERDKSELKKGGDHFAPLRYYCVGLFRAAYRDGVEL